MEKVRAEVVISGRVQGVYFRASTQQECQALGLTGWVRNQRDGTVQAVLEGPRDKVEQAIAWCHQGPPTARVSQVQVTWAPASGEFTEFGVRY